MNKLSTTWQNVTNKSGIRYTCGYCGTDTTPSSGWETNVLNKFQGYVLICTYCNKPTFVETHFAKIISTTPSTMMGKEIEGLPDDVHALYDEARKCSSVGAYTAAVLTCRKILMHVAVEKGAEEGKSFIDYVDFLAEKGYIPQDGKGWVDHIRSKANEANHEIQIMQTNEADDLITFTEMLLRLVYEFKNRLEKTADSNNDT